MQKAQRAQHTDRDVTSHVVTFTCPGASKVPGDS